MKNDDRAASESRPLTSAVTFTPSAGHRLSASILKLLVQISRFALVALFVFSAGAKVASAKSFASNVSELLTASGFNSGRWMWPATIGLITVEVITALLLLFPRTVRMGALLAAALLVCFAGYALYYVYFLHGEPLECGCFGGIIASQLGVKTALRNLVLLVPAIFVIFAYKRSSQEVSQ